ncbi:13489_t:CDS:2, partial [Cetraspora pellucida]
GCSIGYFSGDQNRLFEDIQVLQPIEFPSVPRIFNKLYIRMRAVTIDAPGEEGEMARRAYQRKLAHFKKTGELEYEEWDKLAKKKIGNILGVNVRSLICGAAPLSEDVLEFLRVALGVVFSQGYGQTESTGTGTRVLIGDLITSHVGAPSPWYLETKLVDVPTLNYYSTDKPNPRGEICLRGASIMKGYFKDEKKTKETIDKEGWLHTGDVGEIDDRGCLKIIDRVKNIFKLAQDSLISQIFVFGDDCHSLVTIVILDRENFISYVNQIVGGLDCETLVKNDVVVNELLECLNIHGKK